MGNNKNQDDIIFPELPGAHETGWEPVRPKGGESQPGDTIDRGPDGGYALGRGADREADV